MTEKEICERLGLEDPRTYKLKTVIANAQRQLEHRILRADLEDEALFSGSGRSTHVLIRALASYSTGHAVMIRAHALPLAETRVAQLRDMADRCGVFPVLRIIAALHDATPPPGFVAFDDHHDPARRG